MTIEQNNKPINLLVEVYGCSFQGGGGVEGDPFMPANGVGIDILLKDAISITKFLNKKITFIFNGNLISMTPDIEINFESTIEEKQRGFRESITEKVQQIKDNEL